MSVLGIKFVSLLVLNLSVLGIKFVSTFFWILAYLCEITSGKRRKDSLKDEYIYTRARIQHDHKYDSCGYIARFIFLFFDLNDIKRVQNL